MRRSLFTLLLIVSSIGVNAQQEDWIPDESFVYKYVLALDNESLEAINDLYANMKKSGDKSILQCNESKFGGWYVRKDYPLPEGNYYESAFYHGNSNNDANKSYVILPRVTAMMGEAQLSEVMEHLGNKVTLGSSNDDFNNRYYFDCQVKTSEEVQDICRFLYYCGYDYGILGVKLMGTDYFRLERISDAYLLGILTETTLPFVPKHEGEVLIYEQDWQGVEYGPVWVDYASGDTDMFENIEGTDEGLAITVNTKQGQIWQPQVAVVPDGCFSLEAGHDYIVRLTMKTPSEGTYQVNMGSWPANTQYMVNVPASDDWQEVDVNFTNFVWDKELFHSEDADSRNYLEACHVLLHCGWMVGTTIVKKVQVIEKTKGGESTIKIVESDLGKIVRYNLNGRRLTASTKGINIIRQSDGTTRKVIVR